MSLKINDKTMAVDKNILNELRSIDSIPASEMSIIKHAQRFLLQFLALLRLRSRDSYDANTVNRNDLIHTALITSFFPRSANHKTKNKRVEAIEITKYFSGHFKFSGGSTTPRTILLFLQQALVVARRYYEQNQNPTIKINEKGEYPVFLRDHLSDAYEDIRKLSYQTVAGLSQKWKRAAGAVMLYAAQSKTPDYISFKDGKRVILKIMPNEDLVDIVNFFAFYEHTGLLQCTNRSTDVTERRYYISIIFQCLEADYINI